MLIALVGLAVFIMSPNIRSGVVTVFNHTSSVLHQ
jgi:hypothetical protein